jgi:aryl-alcohol dehydrogenase
MITEALVVLEPGASFKFQEVTVEDDLRDDEVLVEMTATGVCHTDLNFAKEKTVDGLFPAVFGHEGDPDYKHVFQLILTYAGAGVVIKTGSNVHTTVPGDHVILTYSCCGECKYCTNHESSFCYNFEKDNFGVGRSSDGSKAYSNEAGPVTSHFFGQSSFSKYAVVMARSVVKIDKELPLEFLAPLGCGIMTGAGGKCSKTQRGIQLTP